MAAVIQGLQYIEVRGFAVVRGFTVVKKIKTNHQTSYLNSKSLFDPMK